MISPIDPERLHGEPHTPKALDDWEHPFDDLPEHLREAAEAVGHISTMATAFVEDYRAFIDKPTIGFIPETFDWHDPEQRHAFSEVMRQLGTIEGVITRPRLPLVTMLKEINLQGEAEKVGDVKHSSMHPIAVTSNTVLNAYFESEKLRRHRKLSVSVPGFSLNLNVVGLHMSGIELVSFLAGADLQASDSAEEPSETPDATSADQA